MSRCEAVETHAIRRILVALDASAHSLAALDAAVTLAASLHAEVTGLFVEDTAILRMAELPCTREVGAFSGVAREFTRRDIERQLRAQAALAERALAASAGRARVTWSFRVSRGSVSSELVAASDEVDLVTVGSHASRIAGWRHVGSTARAVLADTRCPVLLMRHGARLVPPVMVVFDGTPAANDALDVAGQFARAMDHDLVVMTADDGSGDVERLARVAADRLSEADVEPRFRRFRRSDPGTIVSAARGAGCGLLVLPAESPYLDADAVHTLTRSAPCAVLLTRTLARARSAREADVGAAGC